MVSTLLRVFPPLHHKWIRALVIMFLARMVGIEPTTFGFGDHCSTSWATHAFYHLYFLTTFIISPISVRCIFCPSRIGKKAIVKPWLPQKRSVTLFRLISSRYTYGKLPTNLHSIPSFVILLLKSSNTFVSVSITFFFRGRTQNRTGVASFAD